MSYLQHLFNQPQVQSVQTHNSIESLVRSIAPVQENPLLQEKAINEAIEKEAIEKEELKKTKEFAEKMLLTEREKLNIQSVNEEIEKDLKNAFLGESVTIREAVEAQNYYKLYRDKDETFECKISVEGASLGNSSVRLILESEQWNILLFGKIYKDGRCVVPLKKMTIFPEGTIGKARLEVIIDDTLFVPWEETFIVEGAKKVTIEIKPQSKVSVNLKDEE